MTTTTNDGERVALDKIIRLLEVLNLDGELVQRLDDPTNPFATVELIDEITTSVLHELKLIWHAEMVKATRATVERFIDRDTYAGKVVQLPTGGFIKVQANQ